MVNSKVIALISDHLREEEEVFHTAANASGGRSNELIIRRKGLLQRELFLLSLGSLCSEVIEEAVAMSHRNSGMV